MPWWKAMLAIVFCTVVGFLARIAGFELLAQIYPPAEAFLNTRIFEPLRELIPYMYIGSFLAAPLFGGLLGFLVGIALIRRGRCQHA